MKKSCNRIQYTNLNDVDTISGTTITPKSGKSLKQMIGVGVANSSKSKSESGNQFYVNEVSIQTRLIDVDYINESIPNQIIAKLFFSDGSSVLFGSLTAPALINVEYSNEIYDVSIQYSTTEWIY